MDWPTDPEYRLFEGKFTDGDPGLGLLASRDKSSHYNAITEELINVIVEAGIDPDEADTGQVLLALRELFPARNIQLTFSSLPDLIAGVLPDGAEADIAALAAMGAYVETNVNHANSDPGGGARYQIMTAAAYGGVPDGVTIGGVVTGADHYIGGGSDFVARLAPIGDFWAEMFGVSVDSTQSNATTIFNNAFTYLGGRTIRLPEKRLRYSGEVTVPAVSIVGVRPPIKNALNTALEYGSVLVGSLIIRSVVVHVEKFGVDHGSNAFPSTPQNAFVASPDVANSGRSIWAQDIVGLGRNTTDQFHAVLIEGYRRTFANRLYGYSTWFGVVLKVFESVIGDIIGENNGLYNIIIKADVSQGITRDLSVGRLVGVGVEGSTGVNCEIEAIGAQFQQVNIQGVTGSHANNMLRLVSDDLEGAIINNVNITQLTGTNHQEEAIETNGTIVALNLGQVNLQNCQGKAAKFDKVNHLTINSFFASAAVGNSTVGTDFFTVGADCGATQIDQITLTENFNANGTGVLTYNNPRGRNDIGLYNCLLAGVGAPITQVKSIGDTELAGTVQTYKVARIEVVVNTGGVTLQLGSDKVKDGHQLVVDNASGVTFDVANSGGSSLATIFNGEERTLVSANGQYVLMARR